MLLSLRLLFGAHLFDDLAAFFSVPGTSVRQRTAVGASARSSEFDGEVLGGDLLDKVIFVLVTENLDLFDCDGVEPALDDGPDGGEDVGSVDDIELAHGLGVVVLTNVGGLLNVAGHLPELGDADVLEIHDGARGLYELSLGGRADGETLSLELFVFDDELLDLALWRGSVRR